MNGRRGWSQEGPVFPEAGLVYSTSFASVRRRFPLPLIRVDVTETGSLAGKLSSRPSWSCSSRTEGSSDRPGVRRLVDIRPAPQSCPGFYANGYQCLERASANYVVLIAPDVASISLMDFNRAEDVIAAGYAGPEKVIGLIWEMLSQLQAAIPDPANMSTRLIRVDLVLGA